MKKILFMTSFLICFICTSCKGERKSEVKKEKPCLTIQDKEEILLSILQTKEVGRYLLSSLKKEKSIKVLKNKYLNDSLEVYYSKKKIEFTNDSELIKQVLKISFLEIECNNSVRFSFYYKFEGAHIEGYIIKKEGKWKLSKITLDAEE